MIDKKLGSQFTQCSLLSSRIECFHTQDQGFLSELSLGEPFIVAAEAPQGRLRLFGAQRCTDLLEQR